MKLLCTVRRVNSHMESDVQGPSGRKVYVVVNHRSVEPEWAIFISDGAGDDTPPEVGDERGEFEF